MANVQSSKKLEDKAASTAMNAQKEQRRRSSVLDEDGKLSSASAALSLKYAQAHDLPSYPSAGLKLSSAGAAASIADSNKKNFEHWKPGSIPAANKAALIAKDYEMEPLWQPEMSAAGSRAAVLAHRDTGSVEIWKAQGTAEGQSAAGQAVKTKPPNAIHEREVPAEARHKALLAATGAMSGNRPRAGSLPAGKDGTSNWALKAAASSQKAVPNIGPFTTGDPGFEAARIQNTAKNNVNRQLYGSTPPVALEVEEKNRQDMLRASAVAMAKKMYAIQQGHIDEAAGIRRTESVAAANSSHRRNMSDSSNFAGEEVSGAQSTRYENLEEAARRLAQERLAKLHDEHAEYRQYYGAAAPPARSRLSMRLGRRASTGAREEDSDDEDQSRHIKKQMSIFQSKLAEVDGKKRQADRDALLQAAHRNVEARMAKMDEQVFQETGKASPAQRDLWEQQAREKAQKASDERMVNTGKVHIGGGKYLDQAEIDAIAKARLQPTLDEISATAEKQRQRDEELRAEALRVQEQQAKDKAEEAKAKAEMKAAREQEKLEARRKKEEEKAAAKEKEAIEKKERNERMQKEREEAAAEKREREERVRKEREQKIAAAAEEKEKTRIEKEKAKAEAAAEKERAKAEKEKIQAEAAAEKERLRAEREEKARAEREKVQAEVEVEKEKAKAEKEKIEAQALAEKEKEKLEKEKAQKAATIEKSKLEEEEKRRSAEVESVKPGNLFHDKVTEDDEMSTVTPIVAAGAGSAGAAGAVTIATEKKHAEQPAYTPSKALEEYQKPPERSMSSETEAEAEAMTAAAALEATLTSAFEIDTYSDQNKAPDVVSPTSATATESPSSPARRESKVKSWFKALKGSSKPNKEESNSTVVPVISKDSEKARDESIKDVALAGRESSDLYGRDDKKSKEENPVSPIHEDDKAKASRTSSISSYSVKEAEGDEAGPSTGTEHTAQVGRVGLKAKLMKKLKPNKDDTSGDDDDEDTPFEEAKDSFADDKLAMPPSLSSSAMPINVPRSSHEQSRFKEEL